MKRTSIRKYFLVVAIAALLFTACDQSQVKKAKASQTIANLVDAAIALVPSFRDQGSIDEREADIALASLRHVKMALAEFNTRAAGYKTFDPRARAELARAFSVLHIKDP